MTTNSQSAHLDLLPRKDLDSIKKQIEEIKFGELRFVIDGEYIYFIYNDSLSCVKINNDGKGIFNLFFDGRIIKFNRNTGNIIIFDFVKNSQTYLCIGNFFQNPSKKNILLQRFLYNIIHEYDIQRFNGTHIRHVRVFWEPTKMFVHIEPHGRERLDTPHDCISFRDLLKDIKLFFWIQWVSSLVSSLNKYEHLVIFQKELLRLKKDESFRYPQSIQMLYNGGYLDIPISNSFIGFLFRKFLEDYVDKMVIMKWAEKMFRDIFGRVIHSFFMNFGELEKSTSQMNNLNGLYPSFNSLISLECDYSNIPNIPELLHRLHTKSNKKRKIE